MSWSRRYVTLLIMTSYILVIIKFPTSSLMTGDDHLLKTDHKCIIIVQRYQQTASSFWSNTASSEFTARRRKETLTLATAVVPQAAALLGHLQLCAQALALVVTGLEKEHRQLPNAAPFAARQLRWPEAHLLQHVDLLTWTQTFPKNAKSADSLKQRLRSVTHNECKSTSDFIGSSFIWRPCLF